MRVLDLTRSGVGVLLCADFVVLGDLDPLVGLHAGLTQPLPTLHTEADGPSVVFTTGANLWTEQQRAGRYSPEERFSRTGPGMASTVAEGIFKLNL